MRRQLSVDDLARSLGLAGPQGVWAYERGARLPSPEHLPSLAATLGVSLDSLFGVSEATEPPPTRYVERTPDHEFQQKVLGWESQLKTRRCSSPRLFGTPLLTREVREHLYVKRRGGRLESDEFDTLQHLADQRFAEFEKGQWVICELWPQTNVDDFVAQKGIFSGLTVSAVLAQLERVLAVLRGRHALRYQVRITPMLTRPVYEIFDDRMVAFHMVSKVLVLEDVRWVREFEEDFRYAWGQSGNESNVEKYLEGKRRDLEETASQS